MNEQLDPGQHRFRIVQRFDLAPKPGVERPTHLEELTAVPNDNGNYALFESQAHCPARNCMRTGRIQHETMQPPCKHSPAGILTPDKPFWFRPRCRPPPPRPPPMTIPGPSNGRVTRPRNIRFATQAGAPTVLLVNDKFDPLLAGARGWPAGAVVALQLYHARCLFAPGGRTRWNSSSPFRMARCMRPWRLSGLDCSSAVV